jgi:hypothetical protein
MIGHDERFAYERIQPTQDIDFVGVVDDGTDAGQVEAAGEDRRDAQQRPFILGQQIVGPVDCVAQRDVALRARYAALQEAEPVASRSLTSIALIAAMRAAASSMPRGSPSTRSQISVTAAAVCES